MIKDGVDSGRAGFAPRVLLVVFAISLLLAFGSVAKAQLSTNASITGTVTDSSGAVVPAAKVDVTDQDTKVVISTETNGSGVYVLPSLTVGTYTVKVTKEGFKEYVENDIILHPATVQTVNVMLSPGAVTSLVTVSAGTVAVESSTSEVANQVESGQIGILPLNGRNYQALAAMMPGVVNTSAGSAIGTGGRSTSDVLDINGVINSRLFKALDGVWDENTGNMSASTVVPNPDTLDEVRVLQNNYSTKYSLMGASVILMQTKSGTSAFHGAAFEYVRNTDLNARNFFAPPVSTATAPAIPPYHQNIFGYNLGGPLYIPHVFNAARQNTFFFWSQQWVRLDAPPSSYPNGTTATSSEYTAPYQVPSTAPIHLPGASSCFYPSIGPLPGYTGTPAAQVYQLLPSGGVSALTGTGCPTALPAVNTNSTAFLAALYPAPNYSTGGSTNYENLNPQITDQLDTQIKIDHNIGTRYHLMGEYLREYQSYKQYSISTSPLNWEEDYTRNSMAQLAFTATVSPRMVNTTSLAFNIYDLYLDVEGIDYVNQIPGFSETLPYNGYLSNRIPVVTFSNVGWSLFGEGITVARPLYHAGDLDDTISDDWSWLKGKHYVQAGINIVINGKRQNQTGAAGGTAGTWTFTGTYTGNSLADFLLGDAATFGQNANEVRGYMKGRIVSPYVEDRIQVTKRLTVTAGVRFWNMPWPHAQSGMGAMFMPSDFNPANAPAVTTGGSLATALPAGAFYTNGLVINGVGGTPLNYVNLHNWYTGPMVGFAWDVFGDGKTSLRGGYGLTYTKVFTNQDCSFNCMSNPPLLGSTSLTGNTASPLTFPTPGSSGTVKPNNGLEALSVADPQTKASSFASYSLSLEHQFKKNWLAMIAWAGDAARNIQNTGFNENTPAPTTINGVHYDFNPNMNPPTDYSTNYDAPYQGYGSLTEIGTQASDNWNALEVAVRHPVSNNLFFTAAYTWSHNLGNGTGGVNMYNLEYDYGNEESINWPEIFTTTLTYNLPWFRQSKGIAGQTLGGWKFSDITTWRTGSSFSASLSGSNLGPNGRPNITSHDFYPATRTITDWLSTAPYSAPSPGYYGNEPLGTLEGPRLSDFDMAVYKDFHLYERAKLEFRAEAFNVFNHTNFNNPGSAWSATSTSFGVITGAASPRVMEFALRLDF
jgi:hypothetical protein